MDVGFQAEGLSGGVLLGVRGQGGIGLFDWESGALVRRIEVDPKNVSPDDGFKLRVSKTDRRPGVLERERRSCHPSL